MTSVEKDEKDDVFVPADKVKRRYGGISDMTLWRWGQDSELGFPAPRYLGRLRYWKLAELQAWEASRPRGRGAA
jgi:predicted DNA-binding transcriptional regulator AlpA